MAYNPDDIFSWSDLLHIIDSYDHLGAEARARHKRDHLEGITQENSLARDVVTGKADLSSVYDETIQELRTGNYDPEDPHYRLKILELTSIVGKIPEMDPDLWDMVKDDELLFILAWR
ncbi:MAG: hypothetical protein KJ709_08515 [Nanoarchaeota archaeon]|nr:hypothetical protein [Nanoarchaeota archaeon]